MILFIVKNHKRQKIISGYTLIELVIVLLLLGILLTFAIGPLRGMLLRNKVANQANLLQLDLSFARSEAVSRAYPSIVLPRESWSSGWDIVIDKNNNGILDEGEDKVRSTTYEDIKIKLIDSENNSPLIFTSFGNLKSASERNFLIKHEELPKSKMIVIAAAGSISVRTIENETD